MEWAGIGVKTSAPVQQAQHLGIREMKPVKGVKPLGKVTWLALQDLTTLSGHVLIDSRGDEANPKHCSGQKQP